MKIVALAFVVGCGTDPTPHVVADGLAMPADLQVAGDEVYSLQYDGSILAVDRGTVIPAVRSVAANEIPVDLDTYNLVVTTDALYWTSNATGTPTVQRAALDGSGTTVLDHSFAPFRALVATDQGACWAGATAIACEHGVLVDGVEANVLLAAGPTVYFATAGGIFSTDGGDVKTLVTGVHDVRALAITDDQQMLWTDAGTRTCEGLCTSNLDASLHTFSLAEPDGGARVISDGYASIEDGLAVVDGRAYFASDARLRSRSLHGIEVPGDETLVSHATLACRALAVASGQMYCASDNAIEAIAIP